MRGLSCASIKATAAIRGIDGERTQAEVVMLLAQGLAYGDHVIDVIVKVEPVARKGRVGESGACNVDVIERERRFHGTAQQGRVMARHGRDDQKLLPQLGDACAKLRFKTI